MRKKLLVLTFILFVLNSISMEASPTKNKQSVAHSTLAKSQKILSLRHDMTPYGISEAVDHEMDGKPYRLLGIKFQIKRPISKKEGRKIMFDTINELLNQLNSNQDMKKFLNVYPFTLKNIEVSLYISEPSGREVYEPNFAVLSFQGSQFVYKKYSREQEHGFSSIDVETYEEALERAK